MKIIMFVLSCAITISVFSCCLTVGPITESALLSSAGRMVLMRGMTGRGIVGTSTSAAFKRAFRVTATGSIEVADVF